MKQHLLVLFGCVLIVHMISAHRHHHHHHPHDHQGGHHHHGWPSHHHDWHHGRRHWSHHSFINFEVREPKGLEVSMIQRGPEQTFFGIEVFVNQDPEESNASCDVCHNTTEVINKKFIIDDPEVVIRRGDVLSFYVLSGNETEVFRHHLQKQWVTDSIINKCNCQTGSEDPDIDVRYTDTSSNDRDPHQSNSNQPPVQTSTLFPVQPTTDHPTEFEDVEKTFQNGIESSEETQFECDLDPETNLCRTPKFERKSASQKPGAMQREVQILSEIINHMKTQGCTARQSSNKLLLKQAPLQASDINELRNFVQSYLSIGPELQELGGKIHRVMPAGPALGRGVIFEMRNYVAKQKLLYLARTNNLKQVVDYDNSSKDV